MSFIKDLYKKNAERQVEWGGSDKIDEMFKAVELVGEVGELCNNIKKIKREQLGLKGSRCSRKDLESEFGDVMITLALLAEYMCIDLEKVTKEKFNETSDKMGFKTRFEGVDNGMELFDLQYDMYIDRINNLDDLHAIINNMPESATHYNPVRHGYITDVRKILKSGLTQYKYWVDDALVEYKTEFLSILYDMVPIEFIKHHISVLEKGES